MFRKYLDRYILATGLSLRLFGLAHGSLWHDEAFTGLVSPLPWDRFWEALLGDVHPPLWYLISRPFVHLLGNNPASLRLPAMLCSVAALWLFWRLLLFVGARREKHNSESKIKTAVPLPPELLAALVLMAISPLQIYYAQEARMYAAVTLCCVAMLYGVVVDKPWVFGAGAVGSLWLHNLGGIYVLAGVVALVITQFVRRGGVTPPVHPPVPTPLHPPLHGWWIPGYISAIAALPAVVWTWFQIQNVVGGYWIIDHTVGSWLYNTLYCQLAGQGVIDSRISWNAAIISLMLGLGGLVLGIRERRWAWIVLAWLPGLIILALSNLVRPLLLARTLIGGSPALYLLGGQLFDTKRRRIALALCLAPVLVVGLSRHYLLDRRGDVGGLMDEIRAEDPQVVMHSQTGGWILMQWHMPEVEHVLWDGAYSGLSNAVSERTARALGMDRAALMDLTRPVAVVFADYALVSPQERQGMLGELDAAGAELAYVLADDPYQRVDLWMLR